MCENSVAGGATGGAWPWIPARIGRTLGRGRVWRLVKSLEARRTVDACPCWSDLSRNCRHQPLDPDQGNPTLDGVVQHVQRHVCADATQPPGQDMAGARPRLDGAERGLDEMRMWPSGDPTVVPGGATPFACAGLARVRPIAPHLQALLFAQGAMRQRLSRRAAIDIGVMVIGKVGLQEMALRPGAGRIRSGYGRGDAGLVAGKDFKSAELFPVGQDVPIVAARLPSPV